MDVQCRRFAFGLRTFPRTSGVDSRRGHLDDTRLGSLDSLCVAGKRFLLFNHSGAYGWNHRGTNRAAPGAHGSDSLDLRICLVPFHANRLTLDDFASVERECGASDSTGMGKPLQQLLEFLDRDVCRRRRGFLAHRTCVFVDLAVGGGTPTMGEGARAEAASNLGAAGCGQDPREPPTRMSALLTDQAPLLADSVPTSAIGKKS